jgi:excinuclease ABC subunit A
MSQKLIRVINVRQNNLKGISLEIPAYRIISVSGRSGSGKSSLAFDVLFAEGQRRFIETFSAYARQFLERLDRPQAERIENIPPAIAVDRKAPVRTSRSTVGTMTEITDYLKLLFARRGILHCSGCGRPVKAALPGDVWREVSAQPAGSRLVLTFPAPATARERLLQLGFERIWTGADFLPLAAAPPTGDFQVVVDRFQASANIRARVFDSAEQAFRHGPGRVTLWLVDARRSLVFSSRLECPECRLSYAPPPVNLFSFNSPLGACPSCRGFGRIIDVDWELGIPDPRLSLEQGAIKPFGGASQNRFEFRELRSLCRAENIPMDVPWRQLGEEQRRKIIEGTQRHRVHARVFLSRYRAYRTCNDCGGSRFRPEALLYRVGGRNIAELLSLSVEQARRFFAELDFPPEDPAARLVLEELRRRLEALDKVGLSYLTLDRQSRTLSGGEAQRVSLAALVGTALSETLVVLDEPSVGLHQRDVGRLAESLQHLRDLDNTVVLVEHDPQLLAAGDYLLELGPGSGEQGGRIMEFAPISEAGGLTAQFLTGRKKLPEFPGQPVRNGENWLVLKGVREHNLKNLTLRLPLGHLVCITGVSGSGKSTLCEEVLYRAVRWALGSPDGKCGRFESIEGAGRLDQAELVDQQPLVRTPRANPATFSGAMDGIRRLFAATEQARQLGLSPGAFSFNVRGGRCEQCKGEGFEKIEMQFLSDVYVTCPECGGRRFRPEVLQVRLDGLDIHQVLSLTVEEALDFFRSQREIVASLLPVKELGLGYLRLGQPLSTLSGGEAQRLKLSRYLRQRTACTLFVLDEPTTGLHFEDLPPLVRAFRCLTGRGHTLVVVEHNLEIIKCADWVIDLGPEGGEAGGCIVAEGPPEKIVRCAQSYTGRALRAYLQGPPAALSRPALVAERPLSEGLISIRGAREHNLKNIDLDLPRGRLIAVSGVSGSGKSSLVFDVLFSEGQRRYLECLAPYVRQYLKVLPRPEVDAVRGLPPAVAIEQRASHAGRRSTVATLTEIYHYLRLAFTHLATAHCPRCGEELRSFSAENLVDQVLAAARHKSALLFRAVSARKGHYRGLFEQLCRQGVSLARIDGRLREIVPGLELDRYRPHTIEPVLGWLPAAEGKQLVEKALELGGGEVVLLAADGREETFSRRGICSRCRVSVAVADPLLFSFNTSRGACPRCQGLGQVGEKKPRPCPACAGSRLRPEALAFRLGGLTIHQASSLNVPGLRRWLAGLKVPARLEQVSRPLFAEIEERLQTLERLGLGYLELSRSGDSLSGGEAQRVRLAAQLGSNLSGACYVLDEPTIGLHPRDTGRLLEALRRLRDRGNTVVVVEHDEQVLRAADFLVELGPGGGEAGGQLVARGTPEEVARSPLAATGQLLKEFRREPPASRRPLAGCRWLEIKGARRHNLKNIDVRLPLGRFCCVTGVSGSGKSSLVVETLLPGVRHLLEGGKLETDSCRNIQGAGELNRVCWVDHQPIGRTPRSVPATYLGIWSDIRALFAATSEARARGYGPERFSFNTETGRCPACRGQGLVREEMAFLPEVYTPCEQCQGARYNSETLAVTFQGFSVADVLRLTFQQALSVFRSVPRLLRPLEFVADIGLGYLQLGQPSPKLSGGEAQRLKLARELAAGGAGPTLYVLDEPTTGLHLQDVRRLLAAFHRLADAGHTLVIIEHHPEVIREADWVIDLGPEGGEAGGRLVFQGSVSELLRCGDSFTARELKKYLGR